MNEINDVFCVSGNNISPQTFASIAYILAQHPPISSMHHTDLRYSHSVLSSSFKESKAGLNHILQNRPTSLKESGTKDGLSGFSVKSQSCQLLLIIFPLSTQSYPPNSWKVDLSHIPPKTLLDEVVPSLSSIIYVYTLHSTSLIKSSPPEQVWMKIHFEKLKCHMLCTCIWSITQTPPPSICMYISVHLYICHIGASSWHRMVTREYI